MVVALYSNLNQSKSPPTLSIFGLQKRQEHYIASTRRITKSQINESSQNVIELKFASQEILGQSTSRIYSTEQIFTLTTSGSTTTGYCRPFPLKLFNPLAPALSPTKMCHPTVPARLETLPRSNFILEKKIAEKPLVDPPLIFNLTEPNTKGMIFFFHINDYTSISHKFFPTPSRNLATTALATQQPTSTLCTCNSE